jgi:hypothetical protein
MTSKPGLLARDELTTGGPIFLDNKALKVFPFFVLLFEIGMGLVHPPPTTEFICPRNRFLSRLLRRCTKHLGCQQLVRAFLACLCRKKRRQIRGVIGSGGRDGARPPAPLQRTDPASSWFSAIAAGLRLTKVHSPSSFCAQR